MAAMTQYATGKRKSAIARAWVTAAAGDIVVNEKRGNAFSIRLAMDHVVTPRPMSHDLIRSFADHLGVRIERVVITDVKSSTYYASIAFASKGLHRTLDARPSDAIALALRAGCPIYATRDVLNRRTAVHLDAWINRLDTNNTETQQA